MIGARLLPFGRSPIRHYWRLLPWASALAGLRREMLASSGQWATLIVQMQEGMR